MGSNVAASTLLLFLAAVPAVLAVTFKVGDASGWNTGIDYTTWVKGKTFRVGDTLEFQYGPIHAVSVVDKLGFDSCDGSGATQTFSDGDTKINLTIVGTMHFICLVPGHCPNGMKLAVPILAAASTPATPSPPPSPKSPPPLPKSPPPSTPSPPPSSPSSRKPKTPPPSASPPKDATPYSKSSTPSPSPSPLAPSPSPSTQNAASKGVIMSYGVIGMAMVLMYGLMC